MKLSSIGPMTLVEDQEADLSIDVEELALKHMSVEESDRPATDNKTKSNLKKDAGITHFHEFLRNYQKGRRKSQQKVSHLIQKYQSYEQQIARDNSIGSNLKKVI